MQYFADFNIGSDECHGLVRVHCDDDADHKTFMGAKAERWSPRAGWFDLPHFQLDFVYGGEDITRDYAPLAADRVEAAMESYRKYCGRFDSLP
ncbi:hypothetical protein MYCO108962_17710 [Mycobacterium colombiense]|uniref:Uncharacterized protein n=2 Tax=Mycobacterium colombiense TaxID=339268 RepID=J5E571_9MYCO|nr:hypothetical protein MCOL_V214014 [Mycobacterium colombiense CECT 3035]